MKMLAATFLALAAPVHAQAPAAPPAPAAADPARLALARETVDAVWPVGTYERMMAGTMDTMMDSVMASMFDMTMGDMMPGMPAPDGEPMNPKVAGSTMREMMATLDPHFEERMRITNRVMMAEMIPVMAAVEPDLREALAGAYARRFDAVQLQDMNRFFGTPSGRAYAREAMMLMVDPEVMAKMAQAMPRLMAAMPGIVAKTAEATKHLPPPKRADEEGGADENPVS